MSINTYNYGMPIELHSDIFRCLDFKKLLQLPGLSKSFQDLVAKFWQQTSKEFNQFRNQSLIALINVSVENQEKRFELIKSLFEKRGIRTDLRVKELEQLYAISPKLKELLLKYEENSDQDSYGLKGKRARTTICDFTKAKRTPSKI
jgi:hypothetical protein